MDSLHFVDGQWVDGNPPLIGPQSHAFWMSSVVFDGARTFEGTAPDLDLHCERVVESAKALGMNSPLPVEEIIEIAWDGIHRFPKERELYVRPAIYAEGGFVVAEPDSARLVMTILDIPLPASEGFTACLSSIRRPAPDTAPTDAKASCLYPNATRALRAAQERGFENAIVLDPIGNVAEFCTSNLFIVKDGLVRTPAPNGTFLNGITRKRAISLLTRAGVRVEEGQVTMDDVMDADEVFSTGNYGKIQPVTQVDERKFQAGPITRRARELYWEFAHETASF